MNSTTQKFYQSSFIMKYRIFVIFFLFATNRVLSHDVTAAILVFQNNKTEAILVFKTSPLGVVCFCCPPAPPPPPPLTQHFALSE